MFADLDEATYADLVEVTALTESSPLP